VESVLRPEGSLWWERFVKKVGLEPGVKEREREREKSLALFTNKCMLCIKKQRNKQTMILNIE